MIICKKETIFIILSLIFMFINIIDYIFVTFLNTYIIKYLIYFLYFYFLMIILFNLEIVLKKRTNFILIVFILLFFFFSVLSWCLNKNFLFVLGNIKIKLPIFLVTLYLLSFSDLEYLNTLFVKLFKYIVYIYAVFQTIDYINSFYLIYDLTPYFAFVEKSENIVLLQRHVFNFILPRVYGLSGNLHLSAMILLISYIYSLFYLNIFISAIIFFQLMLTLSGQFIILTILSTVLYVVLFAKNKAQFVAFIIKIILVVSMLFAIVVYLMYYFHIESESYLNTFSNFLKSFKLEFLLGVGSAIVTLPDRVVYNYLLNDIKLIGDNAILEFIASSGLYVFFVWLIINLFLIIKLYKLRKYNSYVSFLFIIDCVLFLSFFHYNIVLNKSLILIYSLFWASSFYCIYYKRCHKCTI